MAQTSPWAKVEPDQPTFADTPSPMSVWADSPKQPGLDLHAGLVPIIAPPPQAIPKVAGAEIPPEMDAPKVGKKYEYPAGTDTVDLPQAKMPNLSPTASVAAKPAPETIQSHLQKALQNDYDKDANPMGSPGNHPGFFGRLAHALSHATGGDTRRKWEEQGLVNQINTQQASEATNEHLDAQTAKAEQETANLKNPVPKEGVTPEEKAAHDLTTQINPDTGLKHTYYEAYQKVMQAKNDAKPEKPPVQPHITYDAGIPVSVTGPKGVWDVNDPKLPPELKPLVDAANRAHGQHTAETEASQSRIAANAAASQARVFAHADQSSSHKGNAEIIKVYQPALDSAERMNVMTENYEKAIKGGDQQAMLSLLANHLGMTMGLQKGARLTKDIIQEAQHSMPWLQSIAAKFDDRGYLSGVTLSPQQMHQMVSLGQSRYAEDAKKSRSSAQYLGAQDDGPQRVPGKPTMRYYLGLTNGDAGKAKAMAAEDGWTVK
jgi:hypothetical protein